MGKKLEGKIAVVTGGSAGIGFATAKRFAEEGARVFVTGRRQAELDKAVKDIGPAAVGVRADASDLADIDRLFATVKKQAAHIDVLFVNAGFYEFGKFGEITEEHFDKTFNTNVRGVLFAVQKALPPSNDLRAVFPSGRKVSSKARSFAEFVEARMQASETLC